MVEHENRFFIDKNLTSRRYIMDFETTALCAGIDLLVFNGKTIPALEKFVLLEKLVQSLDNSDKYNTSTFNKNDTKKLVSFYKDIPSNLTSALRSRYIFYFENAGYTYDESNFYKMIGGSRSPTIHLLNALVDILLEGYLDDSNGQYSIVRPLETFSDDSLNSSAKRYIRFCIAVSTIRKEQFHAYEINAGNSTIKKLTTNDLPLIRTILKCKIYLSEYIDRSISSNYDFNMEDDYYNLVLSELYAPMPCELPLPTRIYESFNRLLLDGKKIAEIQPYLSDELLIWLNMYLNVYCSSQDLYFHQILFLLSFASEDALDSYVDFVPSHNLSISSSEIAGYYTDIKHILELPLIDDSSPIENNNLRELHHEELIKSYMHLNLPNWLLFTLCHLTNKQLMTAKYLYITLVLRKRYHPQKDNDSFPSDVLELLRKEIPDIDSLYDICSEH